jgi:MFS family permease
MSKVPRILDGIGKTPLSVKQIQWLVGLGIGMAMLGLTLPSATLPLYARQFDVSRTAVGWLITSFAVARLVFDLVGGVLADRLGTRRVLVWSSVLIAVSSVAAATASGYPQLLVSRILEGLGSAGFSTAAQITLVRSTGGEDLGRAMGSYQVGLVTGVAVGPVVGGVAAELGDLRTPFWIYAGVGLALIAISYMLGESASRFDPTSRAGIRSILTWPYTGLLFIGFALFVMRFGARFALFPLYASEVVGLPVSSIGLLIAVPAMVNIGIVARVGRLLDSLGRVKIATTGLIISAACIISFSYTTQLWTLVAISAVFGVGSSMASVSLPTMVADLAPSGREGTAFGIYRAAGDLGAVVGPVAITSMAHDGSFRNGFLLSGVLLAVAAFIATRIGETKPELLDV